MSIWIQLAIGVGIILYGVALQLIWLAKRRKPRVPISADILRWGVPVTDADSAIGAGWFVEVDGQRVAELTEPRCQPTTPHWLSYVIVPQTTDPIMKERLFDLTFWHSDLPKFRSRKFGVLASGALISGNPPCPDTHRIICRGPYIHLDAGPSLLERLVNMFKRRVHDA